MADIRRLERTLAGTVPLNKARRNFPAKFMVALIQVKTVNLVDVSNSFAGRARPASSYKRVQRFARFSELPYSVAAVAIVRLVGVPPPCAVTLDRTEWQFGIVWLNVMVTGVADKGAAIPVRWTVLPKKGCSSTAEKIAPVGEFVQLFGAGAVLFLAADREFADQGLCGYLRRGRIDSRIRVERNTKVRSGRGALVQAFRLFRSQRVGPALAIPAARECWGCRLFA